MQARRSLFPPAKPLAPQRSKSGHIHWGLGSSGGVTEGKLGTAMSGAVLAAFWAAREYLDNTQVTLTFEGVRVARSNWKVQNIHRSTSRLPLWAISHPDNSKITCNYVCGKEWIGQQWPLVTHISTVSAFNHITKCTGKPSGVLVVIDCGSHMIPRQDIFPALLLQSYSIFTCPFLHAHFYQPLYGILCIC